MLGGKLVNSMEGILDVLVKACLSELISTERLLVLHYVEKSQLLEVEDKYCGSLTLLENQLKFGIILFDFSRA
jgi:hypothetical protein